MEATYLGYGLWDVKSENGEDVYRVDTEVGYCECRGRFYKRKRDKKGNPICKHLEFLRGIKI